MRRCGRPSQRVASVTVTVPRNEELTVNYPAIAVSPDGLHLVYVAVTGGVQQLHLRSLETSYASGSAIAEKTRPLRNPAAPKVAHYPRERRL